jgi:ankyrin repeat protein
MFKNLVSMPTSTNYETSPPLWKAVYDGDYATVFNLLQRDVDVNEMGCTDSTNLSTPLTVACRGLHDSSAEIVQELINYNANVNARICLDGVVPLQTASASGDTDVIDLLMKYWANPNTQSESCNSPIFIAVVNNNISAVRRLIQWGADVNQSTSGSYNSPLHAAAHIGNLAIVKLLIENGAHILKENIIGKTPSDIAADGMHVECARFLQETAKRLCDEHAKEVDHHMKRHFHRKLVHPYSRPAKK